MAKVEFDQQTWINIFIAMKNILDLSVAASDKVLQPDPLSDSLVREESQHADQKFVRSLVVSYRLLPAFSNVKGGM